MNILDKIVDAKIKDILDTKENVSPEDMQKAAGKAKKIPSFLKAMKKPGLSVIGEIKKASPSKGIIDPVFDYKSIAAEYNESADAMSVLTEKDFFLGSPGILTEISRTADIPVLRKDFIIDSYQIYESRAIGASGILLIAAILDSVRMKEFIGLSTELEMDSLVEVHDREELDKALNAGAKIIGINNRDLTDFSVDIRKTEELGSLIPEGIVLISESGIRTAEDAAFVKNAGADGVLVGESLMRSSGKKKLIKEFKDACL